MKLIASMITVCFLIRILTHLLYDQTTLTALEEMFEAARSIMGWLGDCAKV